MYQYTDCYLDNIYLLNGCALVGEGHESYAEIEDVDALHELMMNMEVGSILRLGQPFYFKYSDNGWQMLEQSETQIKVA